ncbi:MAG: hypothetical protein KJT01_07450 [Gemmatimonadetes bacterium]|nr:hypothetical protein [Gemmatimonadota bacterium]
MTPAPPSGTIAGSVLPIRRAEELIATLPGVLSVRIVASPTGAVDEVHVLTTEAVAPRQTVRNIESALMAQLGLRVNHRKISIATTLDPSRATDGAPGTGAAAPLAAPGVEAPVVSAAGPQGSSSAGGAGPVTGTERRGASAAGRVVERVVERVADRPAASPEGPGGRRQLLFEDVEVRRSRTRGAVCQVTVSRGGVVHVGEADGPDTDASRLELTARATLAAVSQALSGAVRAERMPVLEGVRPLEAFGRSFMFVVLQARGGRMPVVLTGTSEVRESPEASVVVSVLDATNRWLSSES